MIKKIEPTAEQKKALASLKSPAHVFLTGPAGVGKSFIIKTYLQGFAKKPVVLASTGAAAVLIKGRTFHSFFGLGIMEGGALKTIQRAIESDRIRRRITQAKEIIIDEISMIHPIAFETADAIAKHIRGNTSPFGGLRLILLGDFFQLPPVDRFEKRVSWLFNSKVWQAIDPTVIHLKKSMRSENRTFVKILEKVRIGSCDSEVESFMQKRVTTLKDDFQGTILFGRKAEVESFNQSKIDSLSAPLKQFVTQVVLNSRIQTPKDVLVGYSPLPEVLYLKEKALVMIRKNDPDGQYVNGSLGIVKKIDLEAITLTLLSGETVTILKEDFHILDGDGKIIATIRNFPITLGWATTIHKSQGASIDRLHINLRGLWEYGQAYVAISRAKNPDSLFLSDWVTSSIKADSEVIQFYRSIDTHKSSESEI